MRKSKFNLKQHVEKLDLDPSLLELLEHKRPLTYDSLYLVDKNVGFLQRLKDEISKLPGDTLKLAFACETLGNSQIFDVWASSVLKGSAQMVYTGRANAQRVYLILCMAAGSSLRRPASEPFRLILSYLTRMGVKPERMDDAPYLHRDCSPMEETFYDRMVTYLYLKKHIKGAEIVAALCAGLSSLIATGLLCATTAMSIFHNVEGYRSSSPLLQLVSAT